MNDLDVRPKKPKTKSYLLDIEQIFPDGSNIATTHFYVKAVRIKITETEDNFDTAYLKSNDAGGTELLRFDKLKYIED